MEGSVVPTFTYEAVRAECKEWRAKALALAKENTTLRAWQDRHAMTNEQKVLAGAHLLLEGLGVDLTDHNFERTPDRMLKVYQEMFSPPETDWPVFDEQYTDLVMMRGHVFYTLCPHHLLPVRLVGSIAYYPHGKVIGASKLVRIMHDANRGPMTQERLTEKIIERVEHLTSETADGAAVMLCGRHGCFEIRGVRSTADLVTTKFSGVFKEDLELQARFMQLAGNGGER